MKEFKVNTRTITDRNDICVAGYLHDITLYDRISPEEEAQLALEIKKGGKTGEKAKKRLIEANLRFVISVANQYKQNNIELSDLISEGNIGLIKAAETFDETRGFKFISYAVWWIRQSIMSAIGAYSTTIRIPSNQLRMLQKYHDMDKEMMQSQQRHITLSEFCEATGMEETKASAIIGASLASVKMDAPLGDDSDTSFGDMVDSGSKTDSTVDQESLRSELSEAISHCLKDREAIVVRNYFGIGCEAKTLEHIAEELELSRERTRQIMLNAIAKLRISEYAHRLAMYLAA